MLEYFVWLLILSLILIFIFKVFGNRIPLNSRVLYGSVMISFIVGIIFPVIVANLTPVKVITVYLGMIFLSAAVLSYTDSSSSSESASASVSAPAPRQPEPDEESPDTGPVAVPSPVTIAPPTNPPPVLTEDPVKMDSCPAPDDSVPSMSWSENAAGTEVQTPATASPVEEVEVQPPATASLFEEVVKVAEAGPDSTVAEVKPEPVTTGDYITAGFKAKSAGDLTGAVSYFLKALERCRDPQVYAVLALEISAVYQECGQYFQAGMLLKSAAGQDEIIKQPVLRQKLLERLVFLETLVEQLKMAGIPGAPYSKIPGLVLMKTNLETNKK